MGSVQNLLSGLLGLGGETLQGGVADEPEGLLTERFDDLVLPEGHVFGTAAAEEDRVRGDVADELRVPVRQIGLDVGGRVPPVLGHEVDVEPRDLVERGQPAVERRDVAPRADAEQLERELEPLVLAVVVGVVFRLAVGVALQDPGQFPVPVGVDVRRHRDGEVEVVATEAEVLEEDSVVGVLAQAARGRTEQVDVAGLSGHQEGAGDVEQLEPGVHGSAFPC